MAITFAPNRRDILEGQDLTGAISGAFQAQKQEQENQRAKALMGFQAGEELRKQGYQITPENYESLASAYQKGDMSTLSKTFAEIQQRGFRPEIQADKTAERETKGLQRDKLRAETKLLIRKANGALDPKEARQVKDDFQKRVDALRKEASGMKETKDAQEVFNSYNKIQSAAKMDSAAGDMSMIFAYMKMLDPGSTVREGEFANAQQATGVPGRVLNMYNQSLRGVRLNKDQRADFLKTSEGLLDSQIGTFERAIEPLRRSISESGLPRQQILPSFQRGQRQLTGGQIQKSNLTDSKLGLTEEEIDALLLGGG